MTREDQVRDFMRAEHRADWGGFGWGCSCGAGRAFPLSPMSRCKAAAMLHLRAESRKAYRALESTP